jgi:hypothetical protein
MKKYLSKPKVRKPHHHHHPGHQQPLSKSVKINSQRATGITTVAVIICGLLGVGITFFATDGKPVWLFIGAVAGVTIGYFFGIQIVKGLSKK